MLQKRGVKSLNSIILRNNPLDITLSNILLFPDQEMLYVVTKNEHTLNLETIRTSNLVTIQKRSLNLSSRDSKPITIHCHWDEYLLYVLFNNEIYSFDVRQESLTPLECTPAPIKTPSIR